MLNSVERINLNPDLGQVLTPSSIALKMVQSAKPYLSKKKISVLDPAVGPATFLKAIQQSALSIRSFDGYDIDQYMCSIANSYSKKCQFDTKIINEDYLLQDNSKKYDFIIMNPPYVRQENLSIDYKRSVKARLLNSSVNKINGRSNLFIYFLYKCLTQLNTNGVMCAIVYDSVLHTQYGQDFIKYVKQNFSIIKFENAKTPFDNVIIDASIFILKNDITLSNLEIPLESKGQEGFSCMSDLLEIRRGTAFPSRKIFLAYRGDGELYKFSKPIIMKPKNRRALVLDDADSRYYSFGVHQQVNTLLLNRTNASKQSLKTTSFTEASGRILLNYYIRKEVKHIFNQERYPASDNFYVCETKNSFPNEVAWLLLNSALYIENILKAARNQGSGLRKLQVYEYKNAYVPDWRLIPQSKLHQISHEASILINNAARMEEINWIADSTVKEIF